MDMYEHEQFNGSIYSSQYMSQLVGRFIGAACYDDDDDDDDILPFASESGGNSVTLP